MYTKGSDKITVYVFELFEYYREYPDGIKSKFNVHRF